MRGEAGQVRRRFQAVRVHGHQHQREEQRRDPHAGLAGRAHDRAPRDQRDLLRDDVHSSSSAPSSVRPVFARKTSSSVGWCRLICAGAQVLGVERADHLGQRAVAVELHRVRARTRRRLAAEAREQPAQPLELVRLSGTTSTVGLPISAFSCAGVPSATIRPWSMIPTRSARTSASSRYCVVRNTVTPSSRASRPTSSQSARAALRVESGRRLVEEEDRRVVDQRERQVEPPLHAARVGAHFSVAGVREPHTVEQRVDQRSRGARRRSPWSEAWRRRCSRPVRNGSSAASCSAAPIEARTFGALAHDVEAGDGRAAGGRREQRGQHVDGRRLAGAVRPEEAVDLARLDRQGRSRRRRDVLEPPDRALRPRFRCPGPHLCRQAHIEERYPCEQPATLECATMTTTHTTPRHSSRPGSRSCARTRRSRASSRRSCSASTA